MFDGNGPREGGKDRHHPQLEAVVGSLQSTLAERLQRKRERTRSRHNARLTRQLGHTA